MPKKPEIYGRDPYNTFMHVMPLLAKGAINHKATDKTQNIIFSKDDFIQPIGKLLLSLAQNNQLLQLKEVLDNCKFEGKTIKIGTTSIKKSDWKEISNHYGHKLIELAIGQPKLASLLLDNNLIKLDKTKINKTTKNHIIDNYDNRQLLESAVKRGLFSKRELNQIFIESAETNIQLFQALYPYITLNQKNTIIKMVKSGNSEALEFLLNVGIDPNIKNNSNSSLLHLAILAKKSSLKMAYILYGKGVDLDAQDLNGNTALILSVQAGRLDIVEFLTGHKQGYKYQKYANPNIVNHDGNSALHFAAQLNADNADEIALELIKCGGDLDQVNNNGQTSIQAATNFKVVMVLLNAGAVTLAIASNYYHPDKEIEKLIKEKSETIVRKYTKYNIIAVKIVQEMEQTLAAQSNNIFLWPRIRIKTLSTCFSSNFKDELYKLKKEIKSAINIEDEIDNFKISFDKTANLYIEIQLAEIVLKNSLEELESLEETQKHLEEASYAQKGCITSKALSTFVRFFSHFDNFITNWLKKKCCIYLEARIKSKELDSIITNITDKNVKLDELKSDIKGFKTNYTQLIGEFKRIITALCLNLYIKTIRKRYIENHDLYSNLASFTIINIGKNFLNSEK